MNRFELIIWRESNRIASKFASGNALFHTQWRIQQCSTGTRSAVPTTELYTSRVHGTDERTTLITFDVSVRPYRRRCHEHLHQLCVVYIRALLIGERQHHHLSETLSSNRIPCQYITDNSSSPSTHSATTTLHSASSWVRVRLPVSISTATLVLYTRQTASEYLTLPWLDYSVHAIAFHTQSGLYSVPRSTSNTDTIRYSTATKTLFALTIPGGMPVPDS